MLEYKTTFEHELEKIDIEVLKEEVIEYFYEEVLKEFALADYSDIEVKIINENFKKNEKVIELNFYDDILEHYDVGEVLNDYKDMYGVLLAKCREKGIE